VNTLMERGLTWREAQCVISRHQRRTKKSLRESELQSVLESLDACELLHEEQVGWLLRNTPQDKLSKTLLHLASQQQPFDQIRWCSFKKKLCNCANHVSGEKAVARREGSKNVELPHVLCIDCEFSPNRCSAIDETGKIQLDCLLVKDGDRKRPPSMLDYDLEILPKRSTSQVRQQILNLLTSSRDGCRLWVGHTPAQDLALLNLSLQELNEKGVKVVDIAEYEEMREEGKRSSLQTMAKNHLGISIQEGKQHCAIEDARVTMLLYRKFRDENNLLE